MNRNVNMTGNFSNMYGKSLKPGDSALIGKKGKIYTKLKSKRQL